MYLDVANLTEPPPFKRTDKQEEASRLQGLIKYTCLAGGSRCVSGNTIIDGQTKTIKELAEIGKPIQVITSSGVRIAEAPFKKGEDRLLKFALASGRSIEVTSDHRFWNGVKWIKANKVNSGDSLAVLLCEQTHLVSTSESFLLRFRASVLSLKKTILNCLDHCFAYCRQYGQRPHLFSTFAQSYCVKQCGERVHNHVSQSRAYLSLVKLELDSHTLRKQEHAEEYNRADQLLSRHANKDGFQGLHSVSVSLNCVFSRISLLFQGLFSKCYQSQVRFSLLQSKRSNSCGDLFQSYPSCSALNDTPVGVGYNLEKVSSITRTAKKSYYTLHVPIAEQYFANGILHHNSGKTFITARNIVTRAIKKTSRHLICRLRFNHVKTSIGMDTLPKVMRLCFPEYKLGRDYKIDKTDWFIEFFHNKSQIWLAGTDDGERLEKILGTEYSSIYFNEASQFKDYEGIALLLTRLAENSGLNLRAYFDCNPPTKKHWIYSVFIKGQMPGTRDPIRDWENKYGFLLMNPMDNIDNLPADYLETLESLPKKHRERFLLGLFGSDTDGALWNQQMIDDAHAKDLIKMGKKLRTVIGVDPAVSNNPDSDDWGIVVVSLYESGDALVEADYTIQTSTDKAIDAVIAAYKLHEADAIVVEVNQGGDLVENVLRLKGFLGKIINVRASKGKFARAEPVEALYSQKKVKHAAEGLEELETEMMEWVPKDKLVKESPNRIDALVWAMFDLYELAEKPLVAVYRADFRKYKHISDNNLLPIKRRPIYIGWGFGMLPAAIICQKMPNGQLRVLDELIAEESGLRRFALSKVRPLIKSKYRLNKFVSVGNQKGMERQKGSDNERSDFDILWDCGMPTEPALDTSFESLTDCVRRSMQKNVLKQPGLLIDPRCQVLADSLGKKYAYNDNNKPNYIEIIEAHQFATMEMSEGNLDIQKPIMNHFVSHDKELGY